MGDYTHMNAKADIGLIGLAVMGRNLAINMAEKGYSVAVYNRTIKKVKELKKSHPELNIIGTFELEEFLSVLQKPRKVMIMVKAGDPVDIVIDRLLPLLDKGDIIIDGGNSHFTDTIRRTKTLKRKGILFVGAGISGGEEGARYGPSIMPGGNFNAWPHISQILQEISAKVDDGTPCCDWLGKEGSGHYVKMVHNGIEYGDMQLISEAYDLMKTGLNMSNQEMADIFFEWNEGKLNSYLIEITAKILAFKEKKGEYLIDKILDEAKQKGTGIWIVIEALESNTPLSLIGEAVFARFLSAMKRDRIKAASTFRINTLIHKGDQTELINSIHDALYASKIVSYAQGFMLLQGANEKYGWNLPFGRIALLWREGCIIRSAFLEKINEAFEQTSELRNIMVAPYFKTALIQAQHSWRNVVSEAIRLRIPVPAMSSALAFFDGYRRERLPANLLQAQRDYFGAHSYERVDQPRGRYFHSNWT